jgi:hypothetical protein
VVGATAGELTVVVPWRGVSPARFVVGETRAGPTSLRLAYDVV